MQDNILAEALSDEALEWIIRLHDGVAGQRERQAWALWQAQSAEHAAAATEAEAIWLGLGNAIDRWQGQERGAKLRRRAVLAGAGIGLAGVMAWQSGMLGRHLLADHQTATAERRHIRLRDGTAVLMNAKSALSDQQAPGLRGADLIRGQALFTVTTGGQPFELRAAGLEARLTAGVIDIDLRPGHVIVTAAKGEALLRLPGRDLFLQADQRIRIATGDMTGVVEQVDSADALAWQRGKLIFAGQPLADLASELERYRGGRVVILGEALAARQLTGVFDLADTDAILEALPAILPVRVNRLPLLTVVREI